MLLVEKLYFCVAKEDFEASKDDDIFQIDYNEEYINKLLLIYQPLLKISTVQITLKVKIKHYNLFMFGSSI